MREMTLARAFTLIEPGPVVLVTTHDGRMNNVMPISWTMVGEFLSRQDIVDGRRLSRRKQMASRVPAGL